MPDTPHPRLSPRHQAVLACAGGRWRQCFGIASCAELEVRLAHALGDYERDAGEFEGQISAVERAHVERYGSAALSAEYADDAERELARQSAAALAEYVARWTRKFARLQRVYPARWCVPALSPEEVRDAFSLRIWELISGDRASERAHCRAGRAWGLGVALRELRSLRRRFKVAAVSVDFWATPQAERAPNQEARLLDFEAETCRALAERQARGRLSPVQKRWLSALEAAARGGGFFRSSQALNLSAASRALGKNRSSALRAYRQLEDEFQRALDRIE